VSLPREIFYDIPVKNRLVNATTNSFLLDCPASVRDGQQRRQAEIEVHKEKDPFENISTTK